MRRRKSEKDQELKNSGRLLSAWRTWHREQLEEVLAGPHGTAVAQVMATLKHMTPDSAPALISLMRDFDWSQMSADVRLVVLHEINQAITRLGERAGLAPIDDSLPWSDEPPTAFLLIKETLFPRKAESPPERSGRTKHGDSDERYDNKSPSRD
jgi:hypothetical protein